VPIRHLAHKGLRDFFCEGHAGAIAPDLRKRVGLILSALNGATCVADVIGVKDFHQLSGDRKGTYAMHVNGNWCVTFKFDEGDHGHVTDVDLEDYH